MSTCIFAQRKKNKEKGKKEQRDKVQRQNKERKNKHLQQHRDTRVRGHKGRWS